MARIQLSAAKAESFADHAAMVERIDRLEHELLSLTTALVSLMEAHKSLVTTLVMASAQVKTGEALN